MIYRLPPPPSNLLAQILAGLLALAGAFFFGLVVLALAVGLGMLAWWVLTLRVWWLRRRGRIRTEGGGSAGPEVRRGEVIEADYEVVSRQNDP